MFQSLSDRLSGILDKLTRRGALTDSDVAEAMREVRRALLEADVALEVVRSFTDKVRAKAAGQDVIKSITPGQMVVKIVHDELVAMLGSDAEPIDLAAQPPIPTVASSDLTPFQPICTPMQSTMKADSRSITIMPVCPIHWPTRAAYR